MNLLYNHIGKGWFDRQYHVKTSLDKDNSVYTACKLHEARTNEKKQNVVTLFELLYKHSGNWNYHLKDDCKK